MRDHGLIMFHRKHESHVEESIRLSEQAARLAEREEVKKPEPDLVPVNVAQAHHPECGYFRGVNCDCTTEAFIAAHMPRSEHPEPAAGRGPAS